MNVFPDRGQQIEAGCQFQHEDRRDDLRRWINQRQRRDRQQRKPKPRKPAHNGGKEDDKAGEGEEHGDIT